MPLIASHHEIRGARHGRHGAGDRRHALVLPTSGDLSAASVGAILYHISLTLSIGDRTTSFPDARTTLPLQAGVSQKGKRIVMVEASFPTTQVIPVT